MYPDRPSRLFSCLHSMPTLSCVLASILIAYLYFFVRPVFFNADHVMQFARYIPTTDPIGRDLECNYEFTDTAFAKHDSPYSAGSLYPPLTFFAFGPFLFTELRTAYKVVSLITLLSFFLASFALPLVLSPPPGATATCLLLFITGLNSYGLQFELERGQFNVIAFFLCFLSIYIFHYRPRLRLLAYLLFSLSIQLKLFPALLIVMLVDSWADWKTNLRRALGLGLFNLALLFCLGFRSFTGFLAAIRAYSLNPASWPGNHSVKSYLDTSAAEGYHLLPRVVATFIRHNQGFVALVLFLFVATCLALIIYRAARRKTSGFNSHLFLACTVGVLVIPSVSHDYKLPLLAGPMAVALNSFSSSTNGRRWSALTPLVFVSSLAYASTLHSYVYKPDVLQSNFPGLLIILAAFTILAFFSDARGVGSRSA
jgi:hypothetical protein